MIDAGLPDEVGKTKAKVGETMARDPVCGMNVAIATSRHHADHVGGPYYFCSAACRAKFVADPPRYLSPRADAMPAASAIPGDYTCPMHPQIHKAVPGSCPICGMALEPVAITAEAPDNPELTDMTLRFWIGLAFAIPVLALDMAPMLDVSLPMPPWVAGWVQLVLATPVVLWAGWPLLARGWQSLAQRSLNMFSLIALGTLAAYLDSVAALLAPSLFPAGFRDMHGQVALYFESAAIITVLVLLGQVLELRARARTGSAIRALLNLAPKTARRLDADGQGSDVSLAEIIVGDRLLVRPGDAVPVDGVVVEGGGAVDEAMVTGEAMPVAKAPGDRVLGGTVNGHGALVMRAERVGADTALARIVALVGEAQRSRAQIQRLADQVAGWFVPAVLAVALLAFAGWAVWGPPPSLAYALVAAVSVLIIACPCALGLATPMSIGVGIGRGAQAGVLFKSAESLERLERADTLVLDKTGTLTEGRPRVTGTQPEAGFDAASLLRLAAALEWRSEHPLAAAILAASPGTPPDIADFRAVAGAGITGMLDGRAVALGNERLMREQGVSVAALAMAAEAMRAEGATVLFAASARQCAGLIAVADPVKANAAQALSALRTEGLSIVMLTGDNHTTAAYVARALGIEEVHAGASPEDKHRIVVALRAQGRVVAFAGDGINDAPALAQADIGIAMGTGTEVAIHSAGITLVRGDLTGIVRARLLSRATMRNIRQNLVFAFAYNAVGIPVAAGVLYPLFGLLLSPMLAALAMSLSSVSVIGNALRLRSVRL